MALIDGAPNQLAGRACVSAPLRGFMALIGYWLRVAPDPDQHRFSPLTGIHGFDSIRYGEGDSRRGGGMVSAPLRGFMALIATTMT
jgi:hypothetical protein